ncbi:hypothetical protein [Cryptosporangium phraense]|uniref:PNPLA domain-containing protein n=1 Tax=Cryptosporangium phraense TaxID=2593070 RepID=A0A545AMS1_9ACTN|nr:hypothetical protein [Cryptosporangium phraense]TQS42622.1 hypothetical protein FL583_23310 [Cryptosporangium phraense]
MRGRSYVDGFLWDNTPLGALTTHAGCRSAVVIHLGTGLTWDRHAFGGCQVVEIRPSRPLGPAGRPGGPTAPLDFRRRTVEALRELGYADADAVLADRRLVFGARDALRRSAETMLDAVARLDEQWGSGPDDERPSRALD